MTDKFLTEEEIRKLDSERTQKEWVYSDCWDFVKYCNVTLHQEESGICGNFVLTEESNSEEVLSDLKASWNNDEVHLSFYLEEYDREGIEYGENGEFANNLSSEQKWEIYDKYKETDEYKRNKANYQFIAAAPQIVKQYLDLLEEHNRYQAESCKSAFENGKVYGELYKRYSELEQENRELVQKVHELEEDRKHNVLIEKIIALKQENQRYHEALEFYADKKNYYEELIVELDYDELTSLIYEDGGEKARQALQALHPTNKEQKP